MSRVSDAPPYPATTPGPVPIGELSLTNGCHHNYPPNTLTINHQLVSPTSSQTTPSPSSGPIFNRELQIEKLTAIMKRKNKKLGVFYDRLYKQKADQIVRRLNDLLSGGLCIVQGFEILPQTSDWLQRAVAAGVDYFVFVNLPPKSKTADPQQANNEVAYFDVRKHVKRIAEVVVVLPEPLDTDKDRYIRNPHYLDRFLRLESDNLDTVAEDALALFASLRPQPFLQDNVYFSEVPKLVTIKKDNPQKSLGLSIMTREMSPESDFPRIVLIKSFVECSEEIKTKLGTYTHVQSYNGVFLDGLDINDVTAIFQSARSYTAQLMVRYIHPITTSNVRGNNPSTMTPPSGKHEAHRLDHTNEVLPIPLFIVGDIFTYRKNIFDLLQGHAISPVSDNSSSLATGNSASDVSSSSYDESEGSDILPPLTKHNHSSPSTTSKSLLLKLQKLSKSDEVMERALTSPELFDVLDPPQSFGRTPSYPGIHQGAPQFGRQPSRPNTAKKRYILQLPKSKVDRRFTHILFRRSGVYLLVVGLEDMMWDPLIQFENLCYWLRQIQTYVGPDNVKRIIVVGVHKTNPQDDEELCKISTFVKYLDKAIREADFKQIMEISRETLTLQFNLATPDNSRKLLCYSIEKCMDVMSERGWLYERKEFYPGMFLPFSNLTSVLVKITNIKRIVVSSQELEDCYNYSDQNYFKTLANYSSACIDHADGNYHLIQPSFVIQLLNSMEMNSHNYMIHASNIVAIRKLPVLSSPFPKQQMETLVAQKKEMRQLIPVEQEAILEWAEKLELIYKLGKSKEHNLYFVPYLAMEVLGEQANYDWDVKEAASFQSPDITILYAKLHIPASYQLFFSLLAELLKDVMTEIDVHKSGRCCINLGCEEAILPLYFVDQRLQSRVFRVYLKYHPLQNIIEFRAKIVKQQLGFLRAVENKLKGALGNSRSYSGSGENFVGAISFALPATHFDRKLRESALYALATAEGVGFEEELGQPRDTQLLKFRLMTPDVQREWASSAPEMKEIPPGIFLKWSRMLSGTGEKWAIVGSHLKLINTSDIHFYQQYPHRGGNGELILAMWKDSDCSYKDLVECLRGEDVRLDALATEIEEHFTGTSV